MLYRCAADFVFVLHFCFVLFAVFGGLLVLRRRLFLFVHLPALIWSVLVELFQLSCPLTLIENHLRILGGESGYAGGFVESCVSAILYADISAGFQMFLGILLLIFNLYVYQTIFRKKQRTFFRVKTRRISRF